MSVIIIFSIGGAILGAAYGATLAWALYAVHIAHLEVERLNQCRETTVGECNNSSSTWVQEQLERRGFKLRTHIVTFTLGNMVLFGIVGALWGVLYQSMK